jgi:hypothetical protein
MWDDAAIERLLDRSAIATEARDPAEEEAPEDEFLAAFKVAHFELQPAEEGAQAQGGTDEAAAPVPDFWDSLLAERYAEEEAAAAAALGKGKRKRKVVSYAHAEGNADSSGDDSDDYAATDDEASDDEDGGSGLARERGLHVLLDSRGGVHGFSTRDRAAFLKAVMRYGIGDLSWQPHAAVLRGKTRDDVREYGALFLAHLAEPPTEGDTFSDGVPKDGMRLAEVHQRIATMQLFAHKLAQCAGAEQATFNVALPGAPRPGVTRAWGPPHDFRLLSAVLAQGYGQWREIALDATLALQPVLRAELLQPAVGSERDPPPPVTTAQQTLLFPIAPSADDIGDGDAAAAQERDTDERKAAYASAVAAWRASLVQGLAPAEITSQTRA